MDRHEELRHFGKGGNKRINCIAQKHRYRQIDMEKDREILERIDTDTKTWIIDAQRLNGTKWCASRTDNKHRLQLELKFLTQSDDY